MNNMSYSILMTVYDKESPRHLEQAILSMLDQTVPSDDFVLVCDGLLNQQLNQVIDKYYERLNVVRSEIKLGLSNALNLGLKECKHELVARMDSDDISLPDRCERELREFENHPELTIVSGTIQEFVGEPTGEGLKKKRVLPQNQEDIIRFSQKRNPFNHPAVMFKKSAVLAIGGYHDDYHRFEDYELWIRMFQNGAVGYNIPDVVLYMRVSYDFYLRRGGSVFAKDILRFHRYLSHIGWSKRSNLLTCAVPHALVCLIPNFARKRVYKLLRKK